MPLGGQVSTCTAAAGGGLSRPTWPLGNIRRAINCAAFFAFPRGVSSLGCRRAHVDLLSEESPLILLALRIVPGVSFACVCNSVESEHFSIFIGASARMTRASWKVRATCWRLQGRPPIRSRSERQLSIVTGYRQRKAGCGTSFPSLPLRRVLVSRLATRKPGQSSSMRLGLRLSTIEQYGRATSATRRGLGTRRDTISLQHFHVNRTSLSF